MTGLTKRQLLDGAARIMSMGVVDGKNPTNAELRQLMTITQYVTDVCLNELEARGEILEVDGTPVVPYVCEYSVETVLTRDSDQIQPIEVERMKAQIVKRAAVSEPIIAAVLATVSEQRLRAALASKA